MIIGISTTQTDWLPAPGLPVRCQISNKRVSSAVGDVEIIGKQAFKLSNIVCLGRSLRHTACTMESMKIGMFTTTGRL